MNILSPQHPQSQLNTWACFWLMISAFAVTGCNTLSSFGLPTGASGNKIIRPAKDFAARSSLSLKLPKELAQQPLSNYLVEVGDTILIEPVDFDSTVRLPGDQIVKPDGTVSLGQFGNLLVMNKTIEQIESEAQQRIDDGLRNQLQLEHDRESLRRKKELADLEAEPKSEPDSDNSSNRDVTKSEEASELELPFETNATELVKERLARQRLLDQRAEDAIGKNQISARLLNWDSKRIYILGEVNSPGAFPYTGHQNVLDGIIEAGGLTTQANHHEIFVARPTPCSSCRIVGQVCYDQIVQLGDTSTNYQLQPGDRVFVPKLSFLDDVKQTISGNRYTNCPRCASHPQGCEIGQGCDDCGVSTVDVH